MLWLDVGFASYVINGYNKAHSGGKHQLWVERANGKSLKVFESENEAEVDEICQAIDYAVTNEIPRLSLQ